MLKNWVFVTKLRGNVFVWGKLPENKNNSGTVIVPNKKEN